MATPVLDWARVTELFTRTFEASPEERSRLLGAETAGDATLRSQVEALLAAHDRAGGVLDRPAISSLDGLDLSALAPVGSLVGRILGPYRVIREIGRGGMGAVYEGERCDAEFEQRVAIKTLRIGADSEAVLQRFRQERRILAGLQHPNIAALFDGGVTEEGLPYFVLEYIDGKPIDEACAERHLDLRARLDLFRQIVNAVQYAHRQLVIHRDLKPSNILVTTEGVVKLVDFGIAKLLEQEGAELTSETRGPLTIPYASPEQVKGDPVTTATDVYSLGVVLYRLLAGRNPLEVDHLSLARAVTAIVHETPPLPSEVAEQQVAVAMQLGTAERLRRELRGELDAIVMMALRKEPDRRYPTVQALGDDLQSYLKGQPVTAAPDTVGYRLRKFVQRRRGLVLGAGFGAVALVAGALLALWQARTARIEARRAIEVSRFLQGVIGAADLTASSRGIRLGPAATVAELLDSAARRVPVQFADDPQSRGEIHLALAHSYQAQERWDDAHAQYDSARVVITRTFGERRVEVARALMGLAQTEYSRSGKIIDTLGTKSRALFEALHLTRSADYAELLHVLGVELAFQGKLASADSLVRQALAVYQGLQPGPSIEKAATIGDLTAVEEMLGGKTVTEAAEGYRLALATIDSVPGSDVIEKSNLLWYSARLEVARGNFAAADSLGREAVRVAERAMGPRSQAVAQELAQLSYNARYAGDTAKARAYVLRAVDILRSRSETIPLVRERVEMEYASYLWRIGKLSAADSVASEAYRSRLAGSNDNYIAETGQMLGVILRTERRYAESEKVLLDSYRRFLTTAPASHPMAKAIASSLVLLYSDWGRPALAAPYLATLSDTERRSLQVQIAKSRPKP